MCGGVYMQVWCLEKARRGCRTHLCEAPGCLHLSQDPRDFQPHWDLSLGSSTSLASTPSAEILPQCRESQSVQGIPLMPLAIPGVFWTSLHFVDKKLNLKMLHDLARPAGGVGIWLRCTLSACLPDKFFSMSYTVYVTACTQITYVLMCVCPYVHTL